jgi:dihydrofolate synthase/folylpolyglutamate synthase
MVQQPRFDSLDQWLNWQETLHPSSIDLGLERVGRVADRLQCRVPAPVVVSVAGTNGKGSSLAMLAAILSSAGYRVGCYTSPHLIRYNERVRLLGEEVSDTMLCQAFERVDRARGDDSLTYFEFGTLAALDIMAREQLDVALLEVGLGGRLDAVNIVDADLALITRIGIDHTEWLGADREAIGREKAGICRPSKPAVCGDADAPLSVRLEANRIGALWHCPGRDFTVCEAGQVWHWQGGQRAWRDLPRPALSGAHQLANAASVLMALELLRDRLPLSRSSIESGLTQVRLAGRIQRVPGAVEQVLDVSHNAQAASALAHALQEMPCAGRTYAVIGMMQDKDAGAFARELAELVCHWYPVGLDVERASSARQLAEGLEPVAGAQRVTVCETPGDAVKLLKRKLESGDRVLVCGSFHTVAGWVALNPRFE